MPSIVKLNDNTAKTIQIYLPDGNPRGIRIADITTRTVQAVLIPRADIGFAKKRHELQQAGVYFLIAKNEDSTKPILYVGEAENCYDRLSQHNKSKDFWELTIAVTSKTASFTKVHGKYLEWLCLQEATSAGRIELENKSIPSKPFIPEQMEAEIQDSFQVLSVLVAALGYPFFERIKPTAKKNILSIKGKNASGQGAYTEEGMVVFAGSKICREHKKTIGPGMAKRKAALIESGELKEDGQSYVLKNDQIFASPSAAAYLVLGRSANGWTEWKYETGKTLDEVIRNTQ